jgi:tetratricopeptide (TPR) repeat protein
MPIEPSEKPVSPSGESPEVYPPSIRHALNAADGYLDLGMWDDAERELAGLPPGARSAYPAALLDYRLASGRRDWPRAVAIARRLREARPDRPDPWILLAYAERRAATIESAREILLAARDQFPREATICYNLACYECQLQRTREAARLLEQALALDPGFRDIALRDADLEPLWPDLKDEPP